MNRKSKRTVQRIKGQIPAWAIMLPSLLVFFLLVWHPLFSSVVLSFFSTKGFDIVAFAGLENFKRVFSDPAFKSSLINSFVYTFWSLIIGFLLPLGVAVLLNELFMGKSFFRFAMYFPAMVPGMAVSLMWYFMYDPNPGGLLNTFIGWFGVAPSQWLLNPHLTIPLIVISMTWRGFGSSMLIYLAALQGINQGLYEAALIDGAGFWKRFRKITLPEISGVMSLLFIMQIVGVFQVMSEPLAMTGGGPNNASMSMMLQSYFYAFRHFETGKSMAVSVITFLILMVLTAVYQLVSRKTNES